MTHCRFLPVCLSFSSNPKWQIGDAIRNGKHQVLFIAGFGPIVREATASRKLYSQVFGINFKQESDEYLHTEALEGAAEGGPQRMFLDIRTIRGAAKSRR
jgi:hypothetical protein